MGPTRQARLRGASTPWQPPPPQSVQVSARQRLSMAALPWASSSPWASRCSQQRQGQACMGSPPQGAEGQGEPPESLCFRTGTPTDRSRVPDCGAWPGGVWRGRAPAPRSHLGCPPGPLASHCPHDATVPLAGQVEGPSCLLSSAGPCPASNPCCEPRCPHGGWKPVSELVRNDQ